MTVPAGWPFTVRTCCSSIIRPTPKTPWALSMYSHDGRSPLSVEYRKSLTRTTSASSRQEVWKRPRAPFASTGAKGRLTGGGIGATSRNMGEGRERLLGVAIGFAAVTVLVVTLFLAAQSGTLWLLVTALLPLALIVLAAYLIFRTLWRRR